MERGGADSDPGWHARISLVGSFPPWYKVSGLVHGEGRVEAPQDFGNES
jgi:hypothetical protein